MRTTTIEIDQRGRTGLGKVATPGTYKATSREDGSVLLEPAQVLTDAEIAVLGNSEVSEALRRTLNGTARPVEVDWES